MNDNQKMIEQANLIIDKRKRNYVNGLQQGYPKAQLNPEALVKGTWSNLVAMGYKLTTDFRKESGREANEKSSSYTTQMAVALWCGTDWCFGGDEKLHDFCKAIFEPAVKYAEHMVRNHNLPEVRGYKILPNGTNFNNGLPASLQYIAPNIMELNAVSKNPDAHKINDILLDVSSVLLGIVSLVSIKMVPELPNPAMEWATQNKIKVY